MIVANAVVLGILNGLDGVKVTFYHPDEFNEMPVVSYYELTTPTGFSYDNAERAQVSYMSIDVWHTGGGPCSRLAIEVDALMQNAGWTREFSRDMPPEEGVYHKAMRYKKQLFFD
ncbi:MAG: hypothetical protein IJG06_03805 [Clostridia bacterium]|nr:hypothetical protein [Clostridia bacterium]